MKDEIKEILDNMKEISSFEYTTDWFELNYEDTKILLDYITNLQEKCESLDEAYKNLQEELEEQKRIEQASLDTITNLQEERDMYKESFETMSKNYFEEKAKTNKAIEYIKENSYFEGNEIKTMIYQDYSKYILEILQGKSDE